MEYKQARAIAIAICEELQLFTEKLNIAGSVRRGKPEVKDIEICCVPITYRAGIFGDDDPQPVQGFVDVVNNIGTIIKGKSSGRYMQILLAEGVNLDLFIPQSHDYYRQYAIRTGSADYSAKVIATAWNAKGYVGTGDGLHHRNDCNEKKLSGGKSLWTPKGSAHVPPTWESEEDFFNWLGVKYLKPSERSI